MTLFNNTKKYMNHNFNSSNVDCPAKLAGELTDIIVKPFFGNIGSYIIHVVIKMLKTKQYIICAEECFKYIYLVIHGIIALYSGEPKTKNGCRQFNLGRNIGQTLNKTKDN